MEQIPFETPSAIFILKDQSIILQKWEERVRAEITYAKPLSTPLLVDTLPLFLQQLAEALDCNHKRVTATEASNVAEEHGGERARVSPFGPDQVLQEYSILRGVIEEFLTAKGMYSEKDRTTVERSIDAATREAMNAYFLVHNKLRDHFVAALSHDLRSPLGVIKMAAEMLSSSLEDKLKEDASTDNLDLISRIMKNAEKIDRLTKNLLDQGSVQFGERLSLQVTECDLTTIINSIASDANDSRSINIVSDGTSVPGYWDSDLLYRAIENLVQNGIKYGDRNNPIKVSVSTCNGRAIISVHNEGNPIPIEDRGLLFQSFSRTKSAQAGGQKGWGIGLSFVRAVAESHGGSVGVDSTPEGGTTFSIDVPCDSRPFMNAPTSF